jgi:predicted nucleic-acid-binding Zn-ribbon protein
MNNSSCPKCGSKDVMADVEVRDEGRNGSHPLRVVVHEPEPAKHGAIWVQGQSTGDIRARVCANCGYAELYADNLAALWKSYKMSH